MPEERCTPGYRPCPRTPSVLTARRQCSGSLSVPGSLSVLRPVTMPTRIASASAHWRYPGPLAVPWPIASALAHCRCPAHCQCSSPSPVLRPIGGTLAYCWCSGVLSVPRGIVSTPAHCQCPAHRRCSGPLSVLRLIASAHTENRGQAPSTTLYSAQQRACRRRPTSSAPASLHLLAAPDAWR